MSEQLGMIRDGIKLNLTVNWGVGGCKPKNNHHEDCN